MNFYQLLHSIEEKLFLFFKDFSSSVVLLLFRAAQKIRFNFLRHGHTVNLCFDFQIQHGKCLWRWNQISSTEISHTLAVNETSVSQLTPPDYNLHHPSSSSSSSPREKLREVVAKETASRMLCWSAKVVRASERA